MDLLHYRETTRVDILDPLSLNDDLTISRPGRGRVANNMQGPNVLKFYVIVFGIAFNSNFN